ncbi:peptidase C14 caspase catalytic subunit p20 [Rhodopirellula sallentina SM41]|uniref:Peptidase C14 caspase catalytic subunit p20 n=1 Tax=Rhodopirellula sallentina SM41 TaxID=1263870 RepID=M5U6L6_9BACT|nr:peptidase C14 caspase catalytic subunit p20 [Rhodopirellula sallentina SM41]
MSIFVLAAGILTAAPSDGATLHVVIAADTTPASGLGGDIVADRNGVEQLFKKHVPANQLRIHVLKDPLSRDSILGAVNSLQVTPRQDSVVFYYSGHGAFDKAKGHFLSLPNHQELLRSELQLALINQEPRSALLVTDCCAGGARFQGVPKAVYAEVKAAQIAPILDHLLFKRSGFIDITSSKPGELSITRGDGKGSLFTYPFVRYLDRNARQNIGWQEIISDLEQEVQNDFSRVTKSKGIDTNGDREPDQFKQTVHPFVLTPRLGLKAEAKSSTLVVTQVIPLSPAFHAGLEVGDHILEINGTALSSESSYSNAVDSSPHQMTLKVHDPNENRTATVTANLNP